MTRRTADAHRGRPGAIEEPARLVIRRPQRGWIAGLLGAGMMVIAGLVAVVVALALLAGVTAVLWRAGQARIPVLVLVCGSVALAGGGFAFGHASRVLAWRRLPDGPGQIAWSPGLGRVQTGLVWEQDAPAIASPAEPPPEESCP